MNKDEGEMLKREIHELIDSLSDLSAEEKEFAKKMYDSQVDVSVFLEEIQNCSQKVICPEDTIWRPEKL